MSGRINPRVVDAFMRLKGMGGDPVKAEMILIGSPQNVIDQWEGVADFYEEMDRRVGRENFVVEVGDMEFVLRIEPSRLEEFENEILDEIRPTMDSFLIRHGVSVEPL